ncbi:hypothetical protein GGH95_002786 [Coemansia sp. RSA 1836]|nr:hypothetical protein GGH95_002786 [Coemansia sp. RSA 1836]
MQHSTLAFAAIAAIVVANPPPNKGQGTVYNTVTVPQIVQPPVIVGAASNTVVQNAATVASTVTVTRNNGASGNYISMAAAALAGTLAWAAYM